MAKRIVRSCSALVLAFMASATFGAQVVSYPFLGVKLTHQTETLPRPLNINVFEIDLMAPGLSFRVTPQGPDPRPIGTNPGFAGEPMETIRQSPRQFANAIDAQIAINASFFSAQTFDGVFWANNLGLTASDGAKYSPWQGFPNTDNNFDDALNITANNQARLVKMSGTQPTGFETTPVVSLYNTVTGDHRLLQSGNLVAPTSCSVCAENPRTAVGLTSDNSKLLLIAVDGRRPGFSEGVTLVELATLLASHGATNAINLDGGGSTQMVMDTYGDVLGAQLVNVPSEAERLVGTNLAVFALPNGDYNENGVVDAADYVLWRDNIGGSVAYNAWRERFGTSPPGSVAGLGTSVPEASGLILIAFAPLLLLAILTRTRRWGPRWHTS